MPSICKNAKSQSQKNKREDNPWRAANECPAAPCISRALHLAHGQCSGAENDQLTFSFIYFSIMAVGNETPTTLALLRIKLAVCSRFRIPADSSMMVLPCRLKPSLQTVQGSGLESVRIQPHGSLLCLRFLHSLHLTDINMETCQTFSWILRGDINAPRGDRRPEFTSIHQ